MRKKSRIIIAVSLILAVVMALAACSKGGSNFDSAATLQGIVDNLAKDEDYKTFKQTYANTKFEEKVENDSIIVNIDGDEGIKGNYEFKLDGDYLTYTEKTDTEDYTGMSYTAFLLSAFNNYIGQDSMLVTGYINGCDAFDVENKYFVSDEDKENGTTTTKIYIAGKYDMPELDTMYINEKALEITDALTANSINGVINCGKIRLIYYGDKNNADLIFYEKGKRSDLTYKSAMASVAKLQPNGYDTFAKEFTELKETEGKGYKVSFTIDEKFKAEHELPEEEGVEYTVIHFGK